LSDADFAKLSVSERLSYARQFPQPTGDAPPTADPATPPKPGDPAATVVDGRLVVGEYSLSSDDIAEIIKTRSELDARAGKVPAGPEGYELKLPETFKVPEGIDFKFDEANPDFVTLRRWAHGKGMDGDTWREMLAFYAQTQIREMQAFKAAVEKEQTALGVFGTNRITTLNQFLVGKLGAEDAQAIGTMMVSARIVHALERWAAKDSTQGAAPFSQAHRAVPEPQGRVSEEVYNKMSHGERMAYARQFPQEQFQKSGGQR
jgi:hypothetical protein